MIFDAGILNRRVDIVDTFSDTSDGWDEITPFTIYRNIAAAIVPARGNEYYECKKIRGEESAKIIIRYRPRVTAGNTVRYKDRSFLIVSVVDPDMFHESLELYCIEKTRGKQ